jgi:hypothetical protein
MQGHYDDQIGGAVGYAPQDTGSAGAGGAGAGGAGGGAGGSAGGAGPPVGGVNGGAGVRIEGDTKDVTASHMTNNSHNEMNL